MEMYQDVIDDFCNLLSKHADSWRIKIDGEFIVTDSNKTAWKRIGDAKNALRNHLYVSYREKEAVVKQYQLPNYKDEGECFEKAYQFVLNERVEFVKV